MEGVMSLLAPRGIAQHRVCQMIDMVQCFETKFYKRRQKVCCVFILFFPQSRISLHHARGA